MSAQDLSPVLLSLLGEVGLAPAGVDRLLYRMERNPEKWQFIQPLDASQPLPALTRLATVLAADRDQLHTSLPSLLTYLNDHLSALDSYHLGIFWHLKGYFNWKAGARRYPAIRHLNRSIRALEEANSPEASSYLARVYDTKGQIAYSNGYFTEAIEDYQDALRINKAFNDNYSEALTYGNLGRLHMEMGDFDAAYIYLVQDLNIVTMHFPALTRIRAQLLSHCGACLLEKGRIKESRNFYRQSLELSQADQNAIGEIYALIGLGKLALAGSEMEDPTACCDQARRIIEKTSEKGPLGELPGLLHHLAGRIHHANGALEKAMESFDEGYAAIRRAKLMSRIQRARFLIDYARLTRECGQPDKTVTLLQEALANLDSTSAEELRKETQEALKAEQHQAWLYHSIRRFTGQEQIESLFEDAGQSGFRGESCEVAILFTDVRNFTSISEHLDPRDLIQFLNDFLSRMIRSVAHFSGYIDKILGDAIMAIFSLPHPKADDAGRALLTALMMREELQLFNARRPDGLPALVSGIGIHYGEVVAGLIGSPLKRSYTVVGDTVNTASRLEGMTKTLGGSILVSEALIQHISHPERYLLRPMGKFRLRGRQEATPVIEVAGENDRSPDAHRILEEIEQAEQALARFYDRQFARAESGFRNLFERTQLPAYRLLQQAAARFRKTPPPEEWTGQLTVDSLQ